VASIGGLLGRKRAMWWGILGPVEVANDVGTEIRLPAGRLRALVAVLLTRANQLVPIDELVELVWDGMPPPHAARTVRVHIVRLRQALGPSAAARIVTKSPGYLCRVGEDELDVLRFEILCRQARSADRQQDWARAVGLLTEALELWRGPPLADVPSELLRQRELPRLDQLRVQAVENHLDIGMRLGRYEQLIPQLRELITGYPLRERPYAHLMRALADGGRRAEALAVYQDARRVLAGELGIEPGPELRNLQQSILAGET
jgi:DNA-binding SARP family transcriptional activator